MHEMLLYLEYSTEDWFNDSLKKDENNNPEDCINPCVR